MSTSVRTREGRAQKAAPARRNDLYAADPRKVLVAVDGSRASNAALQFAKRMAHIGRWAPHAITVAQPVPVYVGDFVVPAPLLTDDVVQGNALLGLKSQLRRHGQSAWPATVRFGPTGWCILESARELGSQLIVLGLGKHGRMARIFGAETAKRIAYRSDVPMIAVHARLRGLPRVVVAGVDFGHSSERSVREAIQLMEPGGELHLVHVVSTLNFTPMADEALRFSYAELAERSFARLIDSLNTTVAVKTKVLSGEPVETLAKYAKSVGADLIALGSHNQGVVERLLLGSTPAEMLRSAPCSVLIAPPPSTAGA